MALLDVLARIQRLEDGTKDMEMEDSEKPTSELYRKIYIGNYTTPPNTIGRDGDLYIYDPYYET